MAAWLDALRRITGRPAAAPAPEELPRATGPAKDVDRVLSGQRTDDGWRFLPDDVGAAVGSLLDLRVTGPTRIRPGEAATAVIGPVRRMVELTVVLRGSIEHRDSLGNRGLLQAPAVRVVSAGAGILAEVGPSRDLRRDGGELAVVTARWAQPDAVTPTVRVRPSPLPMRAQGRSRVQDLSGPGIPGGAGIALRATVAPGATVDLEVPHTPVVVAVLEGTAMVGEALVELPAGHLAVLSAAGSRLIIATRLAADGDTVLLVLDAPDLRVPVVRRELVVAADEQDLAAAAEAAAAGIFGRLPRQDG